MKKKPSKELIESIEQLRLWLSMTPKARELYYEVEDAIEEAKQEIQDKQEQLIWWNYILQQNVQLIGEFLNYQNKDNI